MEEIHSAIGPHYELEEWTASWTRLHETVPYDPPSAALAEDLAVRMSRLISACQPVIERERVNVPPELEAVAAPAGRAPRGRFRRKGRR
jgi:hypothetical protein